MECIVYAVATTDPVLAGRARRQIAGLMHGYRKIVLEFGPSRTILDICRDIRYHVAPGSVYSMKKLHIVAHGNGGLGYVDIGNGLRASQTRHFQQLRPCWFDLHRRMVTDPCIEMNVCSAAGFLMRPVMMGLADDAGVRVRGCPALILQSRLFNPAAGWDNFDPSQDSALSENDFVEAEDI